MILGSKKNTHMKGRSYQHYFEAQPVRTAPPRPVRTIPLCPVRTAPPLSVRAVSPRYVRSEPPRPMRTASPRPVRTLPPCPAESANLRRGWTERFDTELCSRPVDYHTTYSLLCHGSTVVPPIPKPPRAQVCLCGQEVNKDIMITQLILKIEDLQLSKTASTTKKASPARSSVVHLAQEPTICWSLPESAKVLRHHHNNQLRMLTHKWRRLGLQYPSSRNRNDNSFERMKSQETVKDNSLLKTSNIQTGHIVARRDRKENRKNMEVYQYSSSEISDVGVPEEKANDIDSRHNTAVSLESNYDDSDLSDQEKESIQISKWAASMELDLRPEPFEKDLDLPCSTEINGGQFYAEVLPGPLKDLDFTHHPSFIESSESQQKLFMSDPCLAPLVARLLELEKLQAATVQKERGKPTRSRPATAQAENPTRLRTGNVSGSKLGIPADAECSSVTCSLTKLILHHNSLCRNRHYSHPLTTSGHGSRDECLRKFLPKCPQSTPGKLNRTESVLPGFSVTVSPKSTTLNRTKSLKTTKKSTKQRRVDSSTSAKKTLTTPKNVM